MKAAGEMVEKRKNYLSQYINRAWQGNSGKSNQSFNLREVIFAVVAWKLCKFQNVRVTHSNYTGEPEVGWYTSCKTWNGFAPPRTMNPLKLFLFLVGSYSTLYSPSISFFCRSKSTSASSLWRNISYEYHPFLSHPIECSFPQSAPFRVMYDHITFMMLIGIDRIIPDLKKLLSPGHHCEYFLVFGNCLPQNYSNKLKLKSTIFFFSK